MKTEPEVEKGATAAAVRYRRLLLKVSGESFAPVDGYGLDFGTIAAMASQIIKVRSLGVEVAIVVGGGNIFRGLAASAKGMDRATGDYMGMLATVMNGWPSRTRSSSPAARPGCCRRSP